MFQSCLLLQSVIQTSVWHIEDAQQEFFTKCGMCLFYLVCFWYFGNNSLPATLLEKAEREGKRVFNKFVNILSMETYVICLCTFTTKNIPETNTKPLNIKGNQ